ncbi:MAG: MFS transporter [Proteobacteria bacterium]|uniref:MFS transporter n=1 Tax=Candidatus Avisuccinivibrio stercorigallinarum TaxID=2840704 RepID=A0A9D9DB55_9GAMM|nr:MFS transporter [Candidatus Avisuccinivibrio stercorigallinarum]
MAKSEHRSLFAGFFFFLFTGTIYTQLTARLPAVKAQSGITDADVGVALMCMGGGSLLGFFTVGWVLRRLQVRQLLRLAAPAFLLGAIALALAQSALQIFVIFAFWGCACAYLDVSMNTHGIYVEVKSGRSCLSSMHACYSAGCLIGSLLGSAFAFLHISLIVNLLILAVVMLGFYAFFAGHLLPDPQKPESSDSADSDESASAAAEDPAATTQAEAAGAEAEAAPKKKSLIPYFVVFCGLMGMFAYTAEGSVAEWGSIVLHQAKHASEGTAALAYGVFACFMAAARFCCDHLRSRFGDRNMIFAGGILAFIAMAVVILSPSPVICLIAYALMGVGLAPVFPIAISNAGRSKNVPAKTATAIVSLVGYSGLLVIPPLLGFLAQHFGLERALLLPLCAIAVVIAGGFAFKGRRHRPNKRTA